MCSILMVISWILNQTFHFYTATEHNSNQFRIQMPQLNQLHVSHLLCIPIITYIVWFKSISSKIVRSFFLRNILCKFSQSESSLCACESFSDMNFSVVLYDIYFTHQTVIRFRNVALNRLTYKYVTTEKSELDPKPIMH